MSRYLKSFIVISLVVAVVHFCLSWIAFTKSELIHPNEATEYWKVATRVLAFPLVYGGGVTGSVDLFPVLMIANSILWGVVVSLIVRGIMAATRRTLNRGVEAHNR